MCMGNTGSGDLMQNKYGAKITDQGALDYALEKI